MEERETKGEGKKEKKREVDGGFGTLGFGVRSGVTNRTGSLRRHLSGRAAREGDFVHLSTPAPLNQRRNRAAEPNAGAVGDVLEPSSVS